MATVPDPQGLKLRIFGGTGWQAEAVPFQTGSVR